MNKHQDTTFMAQVTRDLWGRYGEAIHKIAVVFPNRRAGLYFKQSLTRLSGKPVWSPQVFDIQSFFNHLSEPVIPDRLTLIYHLYRVYLKYMPEETFDRYFFWGDMLMRDFDEMDRYLVEVDRLFLNLKDQKEMDALFMQPEEEELEIINRFWKHLDESRNSKHKQAFLRLCKVLPGIYHDYQTRLKEKGWAYNGMAQREVIQMFNKKKVDIPYQSVAFVGFNALSQSEKALFRHFKQNNQGLFYWDADQWYLHHIKDHEAGKFLRDNLQIFPNTLPETITDNLAAGNKKITLIGAPTDTALAHAAGEKNLEWQQEGKDMTKTAVILPDEQLLFPVLGKLPRDIDKVNVTMGYPLSPTHLYDLLALILDMHAQVKPAGKVTIFYKHVLNLLRHPLVRTSVNDVPRVIRDIEINNRLYIPAEELCQSDVLLEMIFTPPENMDQLTDQILDLLFYLFHEQKKHLKKEDDQQMNLEQELIFQLYKQLKRFKEVVEEEQIDMGGEIYRNLLLQVARQVKVPFSGEPLDGLQVMGMLETRTLDFERVTVLSMNEGVYPAPAPRGSFIPVNLRKGFGMPTPDHQDATASYYLYRLLQRSEEVMLMYNTTVSTRVGEPSRFLQQLRYECPVRLEEKVINQSVKGRPTLPIRIGKTQQMIDHLLQKYSEEKPGGAAHNKSSLSPSALNTYINCRLRFYLQYVAGIWEPEQATDKIDAKVFGSILHEALENLYQPYLKKEVNAISMEEIRSRVEDESEAALKKVLKQDGIFEVKGHHLLIREVVTHFVRKVLEIDEKYLPFRIIALEAGRKKGYKYQQPVEVNGRLYHLRMGGYIDRIDQLQDGCIRLIDYKSGKDKRQYSSLDSLFDPNGTSRNKAAFQTMYYNLLFREHPEFREQPVKVQAGLYNLQDLFSEDFDFRLVENKKPVDDLNPYREPFREKLHGLLEEILDPKEAFYQTEVKSNCTYCPFAVMCHRE